MDRLYKLQFVGPLALFVAALGAELAARALQYAPSSELLWFINLRMFGIFQRSDAVLSGLVPIPGFQLFGIAFPIFLFACLGLATRSRLAFTVATHLSFACAIFLVIAWHIGGTTIMQASLETIVDPSGGRYVMAIILAACLLSCAITHLLYFRAVGTEIGALAKAVSTILRRLVGAGMSPPVP